VGSSCSNLALLARSKLSQIAVIVTLPIFETPVSKGTLELRGEFVITEKDVHLVIKDLGLSRLGLGDQRFIQNIKNILADFLKFSLDLLAVITNGRNMLVGAFRLFLLLDWGDDAPRSTSSADNVLVSNGQKVSLINCELSTQLHHASSVMIPNQGPRLIVWYWMFTLATSFMYVTISS
jgi:hypothetical protein